jgi:hypothetical protein
MRWTQVWMFLAIVTLLRSYDTVSDSSSLQRPAIVGA